MQFDSPTCCVTTPHQCILLLQAQGEAVIRKALTELQLWGLQRGFAFMTKQQATTSAPTSSQNNHGGVSSVGNSGGVVERSLGIGGVPLVKDWASVLSEIGDHQSLVASLRTSQHHTMFKVHSQGKRCRSAALLQNAPAKGAHMPCSSCALTGGLVSSSLANLKKGLVSSLHVVSFKYITVYAVLVLATRTLQQQLHSTPNVMQP